MSFEQVFEEYRDLVCWYAGKYTNNSFDAEDIAQEVFFRYYQVEEPDNICRPKGWLTICARNVALNHQRQMQREVLMDEQKGLMYTTGRETLPVGDTFDQIWRKEVARCADRILEALNQHNKKWYYILVAFYCLEISMEEVARQMNMSKNAVDCMMRRAKKWIRKHFQEEYQLFAEG